MALNLYNTKSKSIEVFTPLKDNVVTMYTCGPTVYNYPHIGNYRAYIFTDILKRYLTYSGYKLRHVMNITDVDDKTIRDSKEEGKTLKEFTEFYTEGFFKDRDILNIIPPDKYTKATDYIGEMVKMIEQLIEKGHAYQSADGSVYFDIHTDPEYGKLSGFNIATLKRNADNRLKVDEYEKENAQDFALWKAWDENDGDVFWETSLGKGRPGWHIECSAMSIAELGENIDIHTGGVDLIFPHHENEIAQSECAIGKDFVKYWLHNEHLMVDGKKMAKSAGNFYTLRDLIEKGINPIAFRYWLYTAHYRTKINFTLETVRGAQTALETLHEIFLTFPSSDGSILKEYKDEFMEYMDDDLGTPKAVALMWKLVHDSKITDKDRRATLLDFDQVLGFGLVNLKEVPKLVIPDEVQTIIDDRDRARKEKDFELSDKLRAELEKLGYEVSDTPEGTVLS